MDFDKEETRKLKDMLADSTLYLYLKFRLISGYEVVGKDGGLKDIMEMVRQVAAQFYTRILKPRESTLGIL